MKKISRFVLIIIIYLIFWPILMNDYIGKKPVVKDLDKTIIIANHYSNFDPVIIKKLLFKRKLIFIADEDVKKKVWSKFLTWAFECIFVKEDTISIDTIKKCVNILEKNGTVVIFPEGYVNQRKIGFLDFRKGYTLIIKRSKANVLPLYLYPTNRVFKKNLIVVDRVYSYSDYEQYHDLEDLNMFFQSKIMDLSLKVESDM